MHLSKKDRLSEVRERFNEKKKLGPLLFAGLLVEGGIVGYDAT